MYTLIIQSFIIINYSEILYWLKMMDEKGNQEKYNSNIKLYVYFIFQNIIFFYIYKYYYYIYILYIHLKEGDYFVRLMSW